MLKLRDNVLINESQIVEAVFDPDNKKLKLTFTVPVTSAPEAGNSKQITLHDIEAEQVWHILSKDAIPVMRKQSSASSATLVGRLPQLNNL